MVAATSIVKLSLAYSDCLHSVGGNQAPPIRYHYKYLQDKKNTAGSIYNCTAKDVDVTTLSRRTSTAACETVAAQKPGFISAPPCCFLFCCYGHGSRHHLVSGTERHAVTSLFPARQPYLPNYKTLSRQKLILSFLTVFIATVR
jgi:hypothetical protein